MRIRAAGFTLLELILVLMLISLVLGLAAPNLNGFWVGSRVRDTAVHILAMTRWASDQAVMTASVHRLTVDATGGRCSVSRLNGEEASDVSSNLGSAYVLSDGQQIELRRADGQAVSTIDFYPDGRCEPGTIRLTDPTGHTTDIVCPSPTERFSVQ